MTSSGPAHSQPPSDFLFSLARNLLFRMNPERAHDVALSNMARGPIAPWLKHRYGVASEPVEKLGMQLPNRVGLAAGLDKNGDYIDALGAMGFGFIEIGTVTPKPQDGNAKPRLFRLQKHHALINRMGFNNKGVDYLVARAEASTFSGALGINIGKNATTPLDNATSDYLACLERVYAVADYVTVNISSPNTQGLRDLQHGERLRELLHTLKNAQSGLSTQHGKYKPLLVKIAPDMTDEELQDFCSAVIEHDIDGVIAGNTTRERKMVQGSTFAGEDGGLSGTPMRKLADNRLQLVANLLQGKCAIVGVGGISCGEDARRKITLGADLVQLYTGLIYHGPALVRDCIRDTQ